MKTLLSVYVAAVVLLLSACGEPPPLEQASSELITRAGFLSGQAAIVTGAYVCEGTTYTLFARISPMYSSISGASYNDFLASTGDIPQSAMTWLTCDPARFQMAFDAASPLPRMVATETHLCYLDGHAAWGPMKHTAVSLHSGNLIQYPVDSANPVGHWTVSLLPAWYVTDTPGGGWCGGQLHATLTQ